MERSRRWRVRWKSGVGHGESVAARVGDQVVHACFWVLGQVTMACGRGVSVDGFCMGKGRFATLLCTWAREGVERPA